MKKILFLLLLIGIVGTSCKKNWTCHCEYVRTDDYVDNTIFQDSKLDENSKTTINDTKSNAKKACEDIQYNVDQMHNNISSASDPSVLLVTFEGGCEIK